MALALGKPLAQGFPTNTSNTDLYTMSPANGSGAWLDKLFCCNLDTVERKVRVAWRPAAAAIASQHYLFYDVAIPANDTLEIEFRCEMPKTDVITVRVDSGSTVAFNLLGREIQNK